MQRYAGVLFVVLAAAMWGLTGSVAFYCMQQGMAPIEVSFWRNLLAGALFCLYALSNRSLYVRSARDGCAILMFGALCIAGMNICYQTGVKTGGAALTSVLTYTAPVWVAIIARFVFKELLSPRKIGALSLSLVGVSLLGFSGVTTGGEAGLTPIGLGLLAGFFYSLLFLFTKAYLDRCTVFTLYGLAMLAAACALFPFVDFMPEKTPRVWLHLLFLAVFCSCVAFWAYSEGLKRMPVIRVSVIASFDPMIAMFVAWLWWGEAFSPTGWMGAFASVMAVLFIVTERERKACPVAEAEQPSEIFVCTETERPAEALAYKPQLATGNG